MHKSVLGLFSAGALILAAVTSPVAAAAEVNLLTVNPSFDAVGFSTYANGAYSFQGWNGTNYLYNGHYTADDSGSPPTRYFHMDWGGNLATTPANRPVAVAGAVYEMRYDLRTLVGNFPEDWLGTRSYLDFFDGAGARLKTVWGPDWFPQSQARGVAPWETVVVRGVAPVGTARVGVRVDAPTGIYHSNEYNRTQNRHVEVDNFRLFRVAEPLDRVVVRRAPRLVEPGRTATLRVHHATTAPRQLVVRLVNAAGTVRAQSVPLPVAGGVRGRSSVGVPVPAGLPAGDYAWELGLLPVGRNDWASAVTVRRVAGVFSDETVNAPPDGKPDFDADHPRIVYMGRWEDVDPKHPWMHWYGSEVRVRFRGTGLTLLGGAPDNGYGGPLPAAVRVIVDENEAGATDVSINQFNGTFPLASGLPDGVHTVRIFKSGETNERARVDGFRVTGGVGGGGLLRPEPLPTRRIEVFGDSVTSGGTADPNYLGYAPLLGRELDADVHIISKGGTGVAASFGGQDILLNYWDNLSYPNVFNASTGLPWDLSRWKPDAVVIALGHNDQFNDGHRTFVERYADFKRGLRAAYPQAHILSANTVISAPLAFLQNALTPLLAADANHSFAFQHFQFTDPNTSHPPTAGHAAMVHGDGDRFSLADVLEAKMGWGLDAPLTAYERWVVEQFSPTEIAVGRQGPLVALENDDVPNQLRFALGLPARGPVPSGGLPMAARDGSGRLTLTFRRALSEVNYAVEASNDLLAWETAAVNPGSVGDLVTFIDQATPPTTPRRFARLRVAFP